LIKLRNSHNIFIWRNNYGYTKIILRSTTPPEPKIHREIDTTPEEYLPALLEIVKLSGRGAGHPTPPHLEPIVPYLGNGLEI